MANGSGLAAEGLIEGGYTNPQSGAVYALKAGSNGPALSYEVPSKGFAARQELLYYLGSGNLGRTYLYDVDGYLLESPVAYYSSLRGYAMAPGLAGSPDVPSALPMNARCMRCHMSDVQKPLAGTGNHFAGLPFLHGGITCEQCHGDSTQHVRSRGKQGTLNPATLNAMARDSVCISCHLEGDTSVDLPGKSVFDYKPGQDIRRYVTYFTVASSSGRSVTEVEQLSQSVCKRSSGDRMSCLSCHDPHSRPDPAQRVSFYRSKCLACHSSPAFAAGHHPENQDCTSCHMPKSEVRDTPHVAWTDHRILKLPGEDASGKGSARGLQPILPDETVSSRELGLGYYDLLLKGQTQWVAAAETNLQNALAKDPSDSKVETSLAFLYQGQGRYKDAQRLYERALTTNPEDMEASNDLAALLAMEGDMAIAQTILKHAFEDAQDSEAIGLNLAIADCRESKVDEAEAVLNTVLKFNPASSKARQKLQAIAAQGCSR